jgi:hypothetical protein
MKMQSGSKIKNPSDLLIGSTVDQIVDRSMQVLSDTTATWDGTNLSASSDIQLHVPLEAGSSFAKNTLPFGVYNLSGSNSVLVARISRTSDITLTSGSYPNLSIGQYAIVAESSLNSIDLQRKDHVILFRRTDVGFHKFLHIPLHKETISQGYGFFPMTSHPDIYKADLHDPVSTSLPSGATAIIDGITLVNGMMVLFSSLSSGANEVYQAAGVGTAITWTAVPLFSGGSNPEQSAIIKIKDGTAYAGQLGVYNSANVAWSFNDVTRHFNTTGDYWEQTGLRYEPIVANTINEVFRIPSLSSENLMVDYAVVRNGAKRLGRLYITHNGLSAEIADSNTAIADVGLEFTVALSGSDVVLSYNADNSAPNGTMRYFVSRWSDLAGGPAGIPQYEPYSTVPVGNLQTAFAMSDGSGIEINCTAPYVSGGKTRLDLSFPYTLNVNPNTTGGQLEVIVDGSVFPRYMLGVTLDGYYKEINTNTIELNNDYSAAPVSLEVRIRQGSIDTSTSNAYKIQALYDAVVGSAGQVATGAATHSTIAAAMSAVSAGGNILILKGTYTENVTVSKKLKISGQGQGTVISGTLTFSATSTNSSLDSVMVTGNISLAASSSGNFLTNSWQTNASSLTDSGTNNYYFVMGV